MEATGLKSLGGRDKRGSKSLKINLLKWKVKSLITQAENLNRYIHSSGYGRLTEWPSLIGPSLKMSTP